jgi:hypothetical protein
VNAHINTPANLNGDVNAQMNAPVQNSIIQNYWHQSMPVHNYPTQMDPKQLISILRTRYNIEPEFTVSKTDSLDSSLLKHAAAYIVLHQYGALYEARANDESYLVQSAVITLMRELFTRGQLQMIIRRCVDNGDYQSAFAFIASIPNLFDALIYPIQRALWHSNSTQPVHLISMTVFGQSLPVEIMYFAVVLCTLQASTVDY